MITIKVFFGTLPNNFSSFLHKKPFKTSNFTHDPIINKIKYKEYWFGINNNKKVYIECEKDTDQ
jgi:hypothetical protein